MTCSTSLDVPVVIEVNCECLGTGVCLHPAAVGDSAAARPGPERSLLSTDTAHSSVADGHGEQRPVTGRPGPRVRTDGDAAAVPRRPQRPHRHHRAHDLSLAILSLPQEIVPPSPVLLRPGNPSVGVKVL